MPSKLSKESSQRKRASKLSSKAQGQSTSKNNDGGAKPISWREVWVTLLVVFCVAQISKSWRTTNDIRVIDQNAMPVSNADAKVALPLPQMQPPSSNETTVDGSDHPLLGEQQQQQQQQPSNGTQSKNERWHKADWFDIAKWNTNPELESHTQSIGQVRATNRQAASSNMPSTILKASSAGSSKVPDRSTSKNNDRSVKSFPRHVVWTAPLIIFWAARICKPWTTINDIQAIRQNDMPTINANTEVTLSSSNETTVDESDHPLLGEQQQQQQSNGTQSKNERWHKADWFDAAKWNTNPELEKSCRHIEHVCFQHQQWFYDTTMHHTATEQHGLAPISNPHQPKTSVHFTNYVRKKRTNPYLRDFEVKPAIPLNPDSNMTLQQAMEGCNYSPIPNHMILQGTYSSMLGEFYVRIFFPTLQLLKAIADVTMPTVKARGNRSMRVAEAKLFAFLETFRWQTQLYLGLGLGEDTNRLKLLESHRLFLESLSSNPISPLHILFDNAKCQCVQRLFFCGFKKTNNNNHANDENLLIEDERVRVPVLVGKQHRVPIKIDIARRFLRKVFVEDDPIVNDAVEAKRRRRRYESSEAAGKPPIVPGIPFIEPDFPSDVLFDNAKCQCVQRLFFCGFKKTNNNNHANDENLLIEDERVRVPVLVGKQHRVPIKIDIARRFLRKVFVEDDPIVNDAVEAKRREYLMSKGVREEDIKDTKEYKIIGLAQRESRRRWLYVGSSVDKCNEVFKNDKVYCVVINIEKRDMASPVKHLVAHAALDGLIGIHGAQLTEALGEDTNRLKLLESHRLFLESLSSNPISPLPILFDNAKCQCVQRLFFCGFKKTNNNDDDENLLIEDASVATRKLLGKVPGVGLNFELARRFLRKVFVEDDPIVNDAVEAKRREYLMSKGVREEDIKDTKEYKIIGLAQRDTRRRWLNVESSVDKCNEVFKNDKVYCVVINIEKRDMASPVKHLVAHAALDGLIGIHGAQLTEALFMPPGSLVVEFLPWVLEGLMQGRWTNVAHGPTPVGEMFSNTDLNHIAYPLREESASHIGCKGTGRGFFTCYKKPANRWDNRAFSINENVVADIISKFVNPVPRSCEEYQSLAGDEYVLANVNCADKSPEDPSAISQQQQQPPQLLVHHFYRDKNWVDNKVNSSKSRYEEMKSEGK
eukprot:CAMPEP_0198134610 /NCGR_PEP_ID=MMETSP1442-20131203/60160_1 /TAXON_ID= /ORGANISM="Craspedostauros australis, Strain CCMP3328" /LENGTH=1158 /DNA_ID=CAMNT_0043795755 /DNA_START=200 /DNA_END=3676 /DNA_ORIENTATION=+